MIWAFLLGRLHQIPTLTVLLISGMRVAISVSSCPTTSPRVVVERVIPLRGASTSIWQLPVFPSAEAVIVVVPSLIAVTRPDEFTDATEDMELDQVRSFAVAVEGETVAVS